MELGLEVSLVAALAAQAWAAKQAEAAVLASLAAGPFAARPDAPLA